MVYNYLKIALRNLRRYKGYAFINVFGLALGIACCLLIGLYVWHEWTYDDFHEKGERTYRVTFAHQRGDNPPPPAPSDFQVWWTARMAPALEQDVPGIEHTVRLTGQKSLLLEHDEAQLQVDDVFYADSTMFEVFTFPLVAGDPATALAEPNSIVLTAALAGRLFGAKDPMGQTVIMETDMPLTVTGVMDDVPARSHLQFSALISMITFDHLTPDYMFDSWGYVDFYTYFLVSPGYAIDQLDAQMPAFIDRHLGAAGADHPGTYTIAFEHLPDVYLHSAAQRQPGRTGSITNLYIFSAIALFVLLVACFNFTNLATARASRRAKEVGLRKTVGGTRGQLALQFIGESVVLSLLALGLAFGLCALGLPAFETVTDTSLSMRQLIYSPYIVLPIGLALLTGVGAGSYPAFVLSSFAPVRALRGGTRSQGQGAGLRKVLVVLQFGISVVLIIGTAVVYTQLDYLQSHNLSFEKEQMLLINYNYDGAVNSQQEAIKAALEEHPRVRSVAATRTVPSTHFPRAGTEIEVPDGTMQEGTYNIFEIDHDFIDHFGIEVIAGRGYLRAFPTDTTSALVVNKALAQAVGYQEASEIIGHRFEQWGREGEVIGVVENFNYESLHEEIAPLTLRLAPRAASYFALQIDGGNIQQTVQDVEATWHRLVPHRPFLYSFLDDDLDRRYRAEQRFGQVFGVFAGLAILIACLGLVGLAAFTAEQRTKEISVRKVLGATVAQIVLLFTKDFLRLVGVAFVVAAPAAYLLMQRWLSDFAYRADLSLWMFVGAGVLAAVVALGAVGMQAVRTARMDPVQALRGE